jgi:hypothetical protein
MTRQKRTPVVQESIPILQERTRILIVIVLFTVIFLALSIFSFTRTSATSDEPIHLTMGYRALKAHDYRVDPEHPPFLRMWAALPLLFERNIKFPDQNINSSDPPGWVSGSIPNEWDYSHAFLYQVNDGDHMHYPARFMIALLGVVLGILVFCWAREWLGFWPAVLALVFYTFEPNILAHASLVTTDFGITCFIFGSVYFLWRANRCLSAKNLAGLIAFTALAAVSKFSAVVLGPILLIALMLRVIRSAAWPSEIRRLPDIRTRLGRVAAAACVLLVVALTCWVSIWAIYGFHYLPSSTPGWHYSFENDAATHSQGPVVSGLVRSINDLHLLPNAYSEGFLLQRARSHGRASFLDGEAKKDGWWYYFPVAFSIKTPVSLILLFLGGLVFCAVKWKTFFSDTFIILLALVFYMSAAMASDMNIGLRHILPIYPFIILLAALCAAQFIRVKRRRVVGVVGLLGILFAFWLFEFARVYPHDIAFFNSFIGGPQNGYRYLADSNVDWGQDLKGLKRWMDKQGVNQINLAYFGVADPSYYGIQCNYLPGAPFYSKLRKEITVPQLPGYVAISDTILDGEGQPRIIRQFYGPFAGRDPVAHIGYSIHIYWVDSRWW